MARRDEVISVVDYHNGLSWRFDPQECGRWFDKYGVLMGKLRMLRAFMAGLRQAGDTHRRLRKHANARTEP